MKDLLVDIQGFDRLASISTIYGDNTGFPFGVCLTSLLVHVPLAGLGYVLWNDWCKKRHVTNQSP